MRCTASYGVSRWLKGSVLPCGLLLSTLVNCGDGSRDAESTTIDPIESAPQAPSGTPLQTGPSPSADALHLRSATQSDPLPWLGRGTGPAGAQRAAAIRQHQRAAGPEYRLRRESGDIGKGSNPAHALGLRFESDAIQIEISTGAEPARLKLGLASLQRGSARATRTCTGAPELDANSASYGCAQGIREVYLSGPLGLEQSFVLKSRPAGPHAEPVRVRTPLTGDFTPERQRDVIALRDRQGVVRGRWGELVVSDASGRPVPAELEIEPGALVISIDDRAAKYPLDVDPLFWTEQHKLTAPIADGDNYFGAALGLDGDTLVVGAPRDDEAGIDLGAAYVFTRSAQTWSLQQKLLGLGPLFGGSFGASVSVSGDVAVIGSNGGAYGFRRSGTTWTVQGNFSDGGYSAPGFGVSVAVDGLVAAVGAQGNAAIGGAVHVHQGGPTGWGWSRAFLGSPGAYFGRAVALSGDTLVIGVPGPIGNVGGHVVVASVTGPTSVELYPSTSETNFGSAVAISGDTIVVGVPGTSLRPSSRAYVFTRSGGKWTEQRTLGGGNSVSLSGNLVVTGAPYDGTIAVDAGAAYTSEYNGTAWTFQQQLLAPEGAYGDHFGFKVSVDGETAAVSTQYALSPNAVYIFDYDVTLGEACATGADCESGYCVEGVCCSSACSGTCESCLRPNTLQPTGTCAAIRTGIDPDDECADDGIGSCGRDGSCDGNRACRKYAAGALCRPASSECDIAETCAGGGSACPANAIKPAGAPCSDDGSPCTTDLCNGSAAMPACDHAAGNAGTVCRVAVSACDIEEICSGASTSCPPDTVQPVGTVCRAAANECDVAEQCDGVSGLCPWNVWKPVWTPCAEDGNPCTTDRCEHSCSCNSDMYCGHKAGNAGATCRAAVGPCDKAETCTGSSDICPLDFVQPNGTSCRPAVGVCDAAETCSGSSKECPADNFRPSGTACGEASCSSGVATLASYCTGNQAACPPAVTQSCNPPSCSGTQCEGCTRDDQCLASQHCSGGNCAPRKAGGQACGAPGECASGYCADGVCCNTACDAGACDSCSLAGSIGTCSPAPADTVCRPAAGACDTPETCAGAKQCPADSKAPAGLVCADDGNPCTVDRCTGSSDECAHTPGNPGSICRAASGAPCDAQDTCNGASAACPDTKQPAGSTCRSARGVCDAAEVCDGASDECSLDLKMPSGTPCRPSAGVCDPAEQCNGTSDSCPLDAFLPSSTECSAASCSGGVATLAARCTGSSAGCPTAETEACPGECTGDVCGDCAVANCRNDEYCSAGVCKPKYLDGAACGVSDQCVSGHCTDGVCCSTACDGGVCDSCAIVPGTCTAAPPDTVCRPASGPCDIQETCNGGLNCPEDTTGDSATCGAGGSASGGADGAGGSAPDGAAGSNEGGATGGADGTGGSAAGGADGEGGSPTESMAGTASSAGAASAGEAGALSQASKDVGCACRAASSRDDARSLLLVLLCAFASLMRRRVFVRACARYSP